MYTVSQKRKAAVQVGCSFKDRKDIGIQCSASKGSYGRNIQGKKLTYDELRDKYLWDKDYTLQWLKDEGLIASSRICDICQCSMRWAKCIDRSDGYVWECRKQIGRKRQSGNKYSSGKLV